MSDFAILDFTLRLECELPEFLHGAEHALRWFRTEPRDTVDMRLTITHEPDATPSECDLKQLWEGEVSIGIQGSTYSGPGKRRYRVDGFGWLDIDLANRQSWLHATRGPEKFSWDMFLMPLICNSIALRNWTTLHAASLAIDVDGRQQLVLICAPSETGKSTTSIALGHVPGWRLLGDDVTFARRSSTGVELWAYPRHCHVRAGSLQVVPWLRDLPLRPSRDPNVFTLHLEYQPYAPLLPALVVCLQKPNPEGHRIVALDRPRALGHVAHEAVQPVEGPTDAGAMRDFGLVVELVRQAPACALSVGPTLDGLDQALLNFISETNHGSTHRQVAACTV